MPSMSVDVSSEGSPSHKQEGPSLTRTIREVGESSSHAKASFLNAAELLRVSISSKSVSNSSKAFMNFVEAITKKLDVFDIQSSRQDKSFIFGFIYMVKIKHFNYSCFFFFFFFISMPNTYFLYVLYSYFFNSFLHFAETWCVSSSTKISLNETVKQNSTMRENFKKLQNHISTL